MLGSKKIFKKITQTINIMGILKNLRFSHQLGETFSSDESRRFTGSGTMGDFQLKSGTTEHGKAALRLGRHAGTEGTAGAWPGHEPAGIAEAGHSLGQRTRGESMELHFLTPLSTFWHLLTPCFVRARWKVGNGDDSWRCRLQSGPGAGMRATRRQECRHSRGAGGWWSKIAKNFTFSLPFLYQNHGWRR
jgi:hypothetical protein